MKIDEIEYNTKYFVTAEWLYFDTWFNITNNGLKTYELLRRLTGPQSPKEKTQEFKAVHCFKSTSSESSQRKRGIL